MKMWLLEASDYNIKDHFFFLLSSYINKYLINNI